MRDFLLSPLIWFRKARLGADSGLMAGSRAERGAGGSAESPRLEEGEGEEGGGSGEEAEEGRSEGRRRRKES